MTQKNFSSIRSILVASVEVNVFRATETYPCLHLTKLKYNIRRMTVVDMEKVIARIRPNILKACEDI